MGFFDRFRRAKAQPAPAKPEPKREVYVGANAEDAPYYQSFNNQNITFSGELKGYDYNAI